MSARSEQHSEQHEELLRDVVVGDVAADSSTVASRRRECSECARLLDGLLQAAGVLQSDRAEREELLALARDISDAPGEDRIEALRDHPEIRAASSRRASPWKPARIVLGLTLAAAALLAFFLIPFDSGAPTEVPEVRLLGAQTGDLRLLEPLGEVVEYGSFRWSIAPELAEEIGYYVLMVRAAGQAEVEIARLRETAWTDPQRAQALAGRIEWWVEAYGASGEELARSEPVEARRSD